MTDIREKKENVKMHLKELRQSLKEMHRAVTEELILPQPEEVKKLIYKIEQLIKVLFESGPIKIVFILLFNFLFI